MGERASPDELVKLHRTVGVIADALERRRQKVAAGIEVEPPLRCPCPRCTARREQARDGE